MKSMSPIPRPRKILVIMLRRIGDVILTTPAVRALKKLHPEADVDFLVEPPSHEILAGNPDIRKTWVYDKGISAYFRWIARIRAERYDWVVDFMGNPRSAVITALSRAAVRAGPAHVAHRWAYSHRLVQSEKTCYAALEKIRLLKSIGLRPGESDYMPAIAVSSASEDWARSAMKAMGLSGNGAENTSARLVGFAPASRKITRRWPAASYAALGRLLAENSGARILVFRGPGEESLASEIARGIGPSACVAPPTGTLQDLAALTRFCDLLVTNCNGPKHIAVALRVPTLTIHGSSDPACWNPPDSAKYQVCRLEELHCIGCRLNACPYDLECMKRLTPKRVFKQVSRMLAEGKERSVIR